MRFSFSGWNLKDKLKGVFVKDNVHGTYAAPSSYKEKFFGRGAAAVGASIFMLAYIGASQITGGPDLDASYGDIQPPKGGKKLPAVLAGIMDRQLTRGWNPSQSYLIPSHMRTDTDAFQRGAVEVVRQVTLTLANSVAYGGKGTRGSVDSDLDTAARDFGQFPDIWMPIYGTDAYYSQGVDRLRAYNERLGKSEAIFGQRISDPEDIVATVMRVTGEEVDKLTAVVGHAYPLTGNARKAYFNTLGTFDAACGVMQAAQVDFAQTINNQNATAPFNEAVNAVCLVSHHAVYPMFDVTPDGEIKGLRGDVSTANGDLIAAYRALAGGASPR